LSAQLNVTVTATRVSCFGATDGQATANPTNGWFPYTYAWSNGGTTQTIQNLALGTYTVTVTDIDQNTKSATGTVTSPNNIALNMLSSAQICSNAPDGIAKCIASGGTSPYSYLWSNGSTLQETNQLIAGTYTVTMTDSKGCTKQKSTQVENETEKGLIAYIDATPTSCFYKLGKVNIYIGSGTAPYQYLWSNSDSTHLIENLDAGDYTVSVTDVNGCFTTASVVVIDEGLPLTSSMTFTHCGYTEGTAIVHTTTGTPPYQYHWSNGETTQSIDSLGEGTYTASVTDALGCSGTEEASVWQNSFPILIQLLGPKCFNKIAVFTEDTPPLYPEIFWSLNDSLDQIISGQGADSISVQWNSVGQKLVTVQFGINGISCIGYGFAFDVAVCVGTNEPWLAATSVSPNPFSDFLQLEFPNGLPAEVLVTLSDASGKQVLEKLVNAAIVQLPTTNIPAGIYFLKIKSEAGEKGWKVLKQ
ncbi:MAG: T9SS type A sorting domain-containing protein, partial [Saprospiraceae bacterium]|nr:T9SS type A sorting domain-containing protein [Saprospiraceae bacterium]